MTVERISPIHTAKEPGRLWRIGVWSLVLSTFFPYIGLPLGNSTNVPLSSMIAVCFVLEILRHPRIAVLFLGVFVGPSALAFIGVLLLHPIPNPLSLIVWPLHVLPLMGFAAVALRTSTSLIPALRVGILLTVFFALVQKFVFLDRGIVPFLGYYDLPGYASVSNNALSISTFVRRPFAFFPEPSVMAGSLALATVALVLLSASAAGRLVWADRLVVLAATIAIYLSDSGSALVSIGMVLMIAFWPLAKGTGRLATLSLILGVVAWTSIGILGSRGGSQNFSWGDRAASIIGALRYLVSDIWVTLFGSGRGSSTLLYQAGDIPMAGLSYANKIPDLFSVLGRLVLENGMIFGLGLCVFLAALVFLATSRVSGKFVAMLSVLLWVTISGLTISYDSAAWIWALPGICLGMHFSTGRASLSPQMTGPKWVGTK
ncbi:hypothetical protein [Cryobacterium sp. W22_MBD10_FK3]|uniref:hypothetical protein n=1 Tax=Cryobacterium sp. W22_MBD10_FK3 TaxID=3240273 RepID=UPI003F915989